MHQLSQDARPMRLAGKVPVVRKTSVDADFACGVPDFESQLNGWGFMALEIPGIADQIAALHGAFSAACRSKSPALTDFAYTSIPQLRGGNHGFFPFASEIPRLAQGVADPKEFLHVSGAMLDDTPAGSAAVLRAFALLGSEARAVFDVGFALASLFGRFIRELISDSAPDIGLSRESSVLRILHYRNVDGREILAHEHSGIQMLGVQFPPSDRGLQYILHDGTWVEPELAGTDVVLCNIGAMLTSASDGRFRSSTHRVHRIPPSDDYERWSTVLFVHPNHRDQQWSVGTGGEPMWHDATWGDFVSDTLRSLGLTPGQAPD